MSRRRTRSRAARAQITILVEEPKWRRARLIPRLKRAGALTLSRAAGGNAQALTVLLAGDARLKSLNRQFRGKNRATNVLAFPAADPAQAGLGDVAVAYGVTAREAKAGGKTLANHAAHLVVHGVLHLLGYDHEHSGEARIMEALEVEILAALGIANPYVSRPRIETA